MFSENFESEQFKHEFKDKNKDELIEKLAELKKENDVLRKDKAILSEAEKISHLACRGWDIQNNEFTFSSG
ncbi:MAG: hypothetical protein ACLFMM_09275 [Methanohalobium sp.]|uniref:hypothetical protein n=1 Tax=Methanohalobium sp. TaxID=2837493 RepID=UPI00397AEC31